MLKICVERITIFKKKERIRGKKTAAAIKVCRCAKYGTRC